MASTAPRRTVVEFFIKSWSFITFLRFSCKIRAILGDFSTKVTEVAPRERASRPRAPEPAKASRTDRPASEGVGRRLFRELKRASFSREPMGWTRGSRGDWSGVWR